MATSVDNKRTSTKPEAEKYSVKPERAYKVAIIGGGASGLMAGVLLGRAFKNEKDNPSVILLEKRKRVGKKLLTTGNGTCNISNIKGDDPAFYHGDRDFATDIIKSFTPSDTINFFESIGLGCSVREDGRIYPDCLQASAVLDCMRLSLNSCGVEELCSAEVYKISKSALGFKLDIAGETEKFSVFADKVIIATGGIASLSPGGSSGVYELLTESGHKKTALMPSIVQIKTDMDDIKAVKGIRVDATVSIAEREAEGKADETGTLLRKDFGELLFTEYGLSGPVILQISREASLWERAKGNKGSKKLFAEIDFLTSVSLKDLTDKLNFYKSLDRTMEDFLTGLINKRVGQMVLRSLGYNDWERKVDTLTLPDIKRIAETLKNFCVEINGTRGYGSAQVTAGGISCKDFDSVSIQSKKVSGLYATGEVLNIDGDCGGFNLQWAWASAHAVASHIIGGKNEKKKTVINSAKLIKPDNKNKAISKNKAAGQRKPAVKNRARASKKGQIVKKTEDKKNG